MNGKRRKPTKALRSHLAKIAASGGAARWAKVPRAERSRLAREAGAKGNATIKAQRARLAAFDALAAHPKKKLAS